MTPFLPVCRNGFSFEKEKAGAFLILDLGGDFKDCFIDGLRKTGDAPGHKPRLLLLVVLRILVLVVVVVVVGGGGGGGGGVVCFRRFFIHTLNFSFCT